jgi:hypothetical protein
VTLHFPPAKGVIVTSRLATDRLPQKHGPHRRNEKGKEKGREWEREGRRVTDLQDHPPDPHLIQDLRHAPLLPEDIRPVVVRRLPLVVLPEVGPETAQVATQANSHVDTSWPARVLETNVSTCMLAGAAEAAPHLAGPLPPQLLRKVALAKAKERVNPDHLLLLAFVIFPVGAFARMETSASFNTLILLPPLQGRGLSPKLEPNLRLQLFESHGAMRQPAWPFVTFLMTMMTNIRKLKR